VVVFLDYKAAFDSVSHLFLDESLGVAGASDKTRAMFRAVYGKANAVVRVRKGNGEEVFSESFDVRRGVVQGDIFSPLCFIIALARVMELHDTKTQGDGLQLGHDDQQEGAYAKRIIRALLYADDAAILCKDEKEATVRLCSIQSGSKESADMELSIPKTVCMHIHEAEEVPRVEEEDIDRFSREGRLGQNCTAPTRTTRSVSRRRRCRASSMVAAPSAEAERPREHAAAAPALLPRIGCRQRRSDQRRREWRSGQRPMQRPLRRVHLLAVCQPAVPNLSGGGRGTKPPGRYSALKPPICTRQHPRQNQLERSIDRGPSFASVTRLCLGGQRAEASRAPRSPRHRHVA